MSKAMVAEPEVGARAPRRRLWRVLFALSGIVPILFLIPGPNTSPLIYSFFVLAWFQRQRLQRWASRIPLPVQAKFALGVLFSGWLEETLAWLNSYLEQTKTPALFHPQLFADLILAVGFYGGWAVTLLLIFRRWRFTTRDLFVLTGLVGIVVEQNGAVLALIALALAGGNVLGAAFYAVYILMVYGGIMGLAFVPVANALPMGKRKGFVRFPVAAISMSLGAVLLYLVVYLVTLSVLPPKQAIWLHPFW